MLNFDKQENNFAKVTDIDSYLLYKNDNNKKPPFITIFIPTYKRANLLRQAIKSVLRQQVVPFEWDLLVLDNEAYDGKTNDTEKVVRSFGCQRIYYYRNTCSLRVGDNFNRGFLLAKSPWVMMLHDDDLLIKNTLNKMGTAINLLSAISPKPLGAIGAIYDSFQDKDVRKIAKREKELLENPMSFRFFPNGRFDCLFTSHPGGVLPSNGTTFNKKAVIEVGGFNDDLGISADLILFYALNKRYRTYLTQEPYGFYRVGNNSMSKIENKIKTIRFCEDFRQYIFQKNVLTKFYGFCFGSFLDCLFLDRFFPELKEIYSTRHVHKIQCRLGNFLSKKAGKFKAWQIKRLSKKLQRKKYESNR